VVEEEIRLKFWIAWAIDAVTGAIILVFFFWGLADGSVSSFNLLIWIAILSALAVFLIGSLLLKTMGHPVPGMILLLVLAVPAVLCAFFLLVFIFSGSQWK
jgi:hypothetical protein